MEKRKLLGIVALTLIALGFASPYIATYFGIPTINLVYASDTSSDITTTVMEWMPLIITFAMLGMVLGLLKKFGKF